MVLVRKAAYDPEQNRYPKMIYLEKGKPGTVVATKEDHDALLAKVAKNADEKPIEVKPDAAPVAVSQSREDMIAYAEAHNIKIDKRWGDDKIAQAIGEHKGIPAQ